MFEQNFGFLCKYCSEKCGKKTHSWGWVFRGDRSGFIKHTFFDLSLQSMQYPISSINFLWNLSKTFVSIDFVAIRILPLLPARENDLLAPENFKVLF